MVKNGINSNIVLAHRQSGKGLRMGVNVRPPDRLQFKLRQAAISQWSLPELNFAFGSDPINIPVTQGRAGRFIREGNADVRAVAVACEGHGGGCDSKVPDTFSCLPCTRNSLYAVHIQETRQFGS